MKYDNERPDPPQYDVLSIYSVMGKKARQLSPNNSALAMGVRGDKKTHYKLGEIERRHWIACGKRNGLAREIEQIIEEAIKQTPGVIEQVRAQLPAKFPTHVSEAILIGLKKAADALASQA